MASVPRHDSKPEIRLRKRLFRLGYRYRLHVKSLPGTPDIVLARFRLVIFVHGCFWHRHAKCKLATTPSTRQNFWLKKFRENIERDKHQRSDLRKLGWRSVVVWQCEIQRSIERAAEKVTQAISRKHTSKSFRVRLRSPGFRKQRSRSGLEISVLKA